MIDIQDFMEEEYDYRPVDMWTLDEFCDYKKQNNISDWDYPLEEYKHISDLNLNCVPVRFADIYGGYDYRFCETKEDWSE